MIEFDNVMKRMVRVKLGEVLPPIKTDKELNQTQPEVQGSETDNKKETEPEW